MTRAAQLEDEIKAYMAGKLAGATPIPKIKIAATDPRTMASAQINRELDQLDAIGSELGSAMIAAGRGYERPSEYLKMEDPLARALRAVSDRRSALRVEVELRYGPGAPRRLPPGFKKRA